MLLTHGSRLYFYNSIVRFCAERLCASWLVDHTVSTVAVNVANLVVAVAVATMDGCGRPAIAPTPSAPVQRK